jgi:hypothetical protein
MNIKVFVPLLFSTVIGAGCTKGTQSADNSDWQGFPILSPISNADPAVRDAVTVKVPTKLAIQRTADSLSVTINRDSLESTSVVVGSKMVTGVQSNLFVYAEGDARPSESGRHGLSGGLDFNLGTSILNTKQGGIPAPGKKYIVEMELAIFETDIPPQHMWSPYGKNYKILWKRTLRETVE